MKSPAHESGVEVLTAHELAQCEAQLDVFLDVVPSAIGLFDTKMRLLAGSKRYLTMVGLDHTAIGKSIYETVPDIPKKWRDAHARCLAGETLTGHEDLWVRESGDKRHYTWELTPWRASDGTIRGLVLRTEDETERHHAESAAREAKERLAAALTASRTGTFRWDVATAKLAWDESLKQLFGLDPSTPIATLEDFLVRVHPDERGLVRATCERCAREGGHFALDFRALLPDGSVRWLADRGTMYRDADGTPLYMTGACLDITDRKRAEELLAVEARRKDDFLAILAHELRNPLAPIRYSAELLRDFEAADPRLARLREVLERQTSHMTRLVDDLLDISRVARGKVTIDRRRLDLREVVRQCVEDFRNDMATAELALSMRLPDAPLWVDGDRTRLTQALSNVLRNACKFTDRGGHVAVEVAHVADRAVLTVEDDGAGIDASILPHVFEPFHQSERTASRSAGGLGLGLALVRGIVELHGGRVTASSEGPGRGAQIRIELPTAERAAGTARDDTSGSETGRAPSAGPAARAKRFVVIDDYEDGLELMAAMLEIAGLDVVGRAADGESGLATVVRERPDVVLCDIGLPGALDGYGVARAIRSHPELASTRLIALTGFGQDSDRQRARDAGFDDHLVKPLDFAKLAALFDE